MTPSPPDADPPPPAPASAAKRPRRPRGAVRADLIAAGLELARTGGPDAVVLREATRIVGVVPNAAYRHFADRSELLSAVCSAAMAELATGMAATVAEVPGEYGNPDAAFRRMHAIGTSYLQFAADEPGLLAAALLAPEHAHTAAISQSRTPLDQLKVVLDELVVAGVLKPERRAGIEFPIWSTVHGLAVLVKRGPLREMPESAHGALLDRVFRFLADGVVNSGV